MADDKHPGGRPKLYDTPEEYAAQCEAYFAECEANGERPMITGLTLFLGFADKTTLYDYRDRPEFSHSTKRSILRIEMAYEKRLEGNNVTGSIFALKNMGWKDKTESEHYGKDGKPIETSTTIKIIRDTSTGIAPGEFTPESKTGTSAE
jgi:hypothetical protein